LTEKLPSEHWEQCHVVSWFRRKYSPIRIFAIPNGGWRSKVTAMKLKAEGVSRGVPDLFVPEFNLWIEMKRVKGGRLSPDQHNWIAYLTEIGNTVLVCHGHEHAIEQIDAFMADKV
jgi:hypothetical protein